MMAAMLHVVPKSERNRGLFSIKRECLLGKEGMMSGILGWASFFFDSKVVFSGKLFPGYGVIQKYSF